MRLICPNCEAQYEIANDLIPEGGRDVQCSNCGTSWFQLGKAELPAPDADEGKKGRSRRARRAAEKAAKAAEAAAESAPTDGAADEDSQSFEDALSQALAEEDGAPGEDGTAAPRKTVTPEVADILQQEAQDTRRLTTASPVVEEQPDLGLQGPPPRRDQAELLPDTVDEDADAASAGAMTGRALLPDIDEINSTLRATTDRPDDGYGSAPTRRRRSRAPFRFGFFLVVALGIAAVVTYIYPERVKIHLPVAAPYVDQFLPLADQARWQLNDWVQDVTVWLTDLTEQMSGDEGVEG